MADQLAVSADEVFATSHTVGNDAEDLREQLTSIAQGWGNVSREWSGVAASAYAALWQEWHDGAAALIEILAESSRNLARAAVAYDERDGHCAAALETTSLDLGL